MIDTVVETEEIIVNLNEAPLPANLATAISGSGNSLTLASSGTAGVGGTFRYYYHVTSAGLVHLDVRVDGVDISSLSATGDIALAGFSSDIPGPRSAELGDLSPIGSIDFPSTTVAAATAPYCTISGSNPALFFLLGPGLGRLQRQHVTGNLSIRASITYIGAV